MITGDEEARLAFQEALAAADRMRELEGLIHRALVLSEGESIDRTLLKQIHEADTVTGGIPIQGVSIALRKPSGLFKTMNEIEQEAMQKTLEHYQDNITRAAEALGMAKSTFYRKMKH